MNPDNPYEPSSSLLGDEANQGDLLEPAAIEVVAILQRCWLLFTRNPGTVLGAVLIPLVIGIVIAIPQQAASFAMGMVGERARDAGEAVSVALLFGLAVVQIAVALFGFAVSVYLQLGTVRIFTRLARGLPADLSLLFRELARLPSALVAALLNGLAVMLGFLLLIVPGIVVGLGLHLCLFALVDQDIGPIASLRESWRLTEGHKLTLFVVYVVMGVLALLVTCLTCGIGYLAVIPILSLAQSVVYHSLMNEKGPRPS